MWQVVVNRFIIPIVKGKVRSGRKYSFISVAMNEKVYNICQFSHSFSPNGLIFYIKHKATLTKREVCKKSSGLLQ